MKSLSLNAVILLAAAICTCQAQRGTPPEFYGTSETNSTMVTRGDNTYFTHGIVASNANMTVSADNAVANSVTGVIQADGDVIVLDHSHMFRATNATYNFNTGEIHTGDFKSTEMPFNISGRRLDGASNHVDTATNAWLTTDDYAKPIYRLHASTITVVPGKYIEAHNATLYLGTVPVFFFPYYHRSLGEHYNNLEFVPGYRSSFGPYLLSAFNWYGNGLMDGTIHVDEREKRGLAVGPDLMLHLGDYGEAAFRYYYARDHDSQADGFALPHLGPNRQRMSFYYQSAMATNFDAKVVVHYESDPLVVRDFYESEYRANVEPASFAEVNQIWPNFTLDAMASPRLVSFFESVERLPDIKLTGLRQQVGVTPIYYESESSVGYFRRDFSDTNNLGLTDYSATRADTFQQFTLPETLFGVLQVTPRVGGRVTSYGDIMGSTGQTNSRTRGVFNTGVDFSIKASRVYAGAESSFWDVHELRHIIEPDINYAFVPAPSLPPSQLPQFDTAMPGLRLLPIEYPDYNSIDSVDKQNVLRFTLRNKLQTKRANGLEDVVNWALYTDWNLTPGTNHTVSDAYSDLTLRPRTWLTVNSTLRYDLPDHRWRDEITSLIITPNNNWSLTLSHRYLMNNDPEFQTFPGQSVPGHNLFAASFYYRINENWGLHVTERYEAQDGVLQEQDYAVYRDLRSWTAALTFRVTEGIGQPTDFTVAITMSLKAFPRFGLNSDSDRPHPFTGSSSTTDALGIY